MTYQEIILAIVFNTVVLLIKRRLDKMEHADIKGDIRQLGEKVGHLSNSIGDVLPLSQEQESELREVVDDIKTVG